MNVFGVVWHLYTASEEGKTMYDEQFLAELEGKPDKDRAFKEFISKKEITSEEMDDMFTQ